MSSTWSSTDSAKWSKAGVPQAYTEAERLTIPLAMAMLKSVNEVSNLNAAGATAFDNGCGTGAMTEVLKRHHPNVPLFATDASEGMIDMLNRRISAEKLKNVETRVLDARQLEGIAENSFTHTFSTFMLCLAPQADMIASEMYRVTKPGGVLGLAVWADAWFGYYSEPWTKACKQLDEKFQPPRIMDKEWTDPTEVEKGLAKVGFEDIKLTKVNGSWRWESYEALANYFFDGGNPGNVKMLDAWTDLRRSIDEVRPLFQKVVEEEYRRDGYLEADVPALLVTACK